MRLGPFVAALSTAAACAGASPPHDDGAPVVGLPEAHEGGSTAPRRRAPPPARQHTDRPSGDPPAAGPASLERRIDLDLSRAPIAEAFRILADAADFDVVLAGDVAGEVTMRLRRVRARDAIDAIAGTKGLMLQWRGRLLLVRKDRADAR